MSPNVKRNDWYKLRQDLRYKPLRYYSLRARLLSPLLPFNSITISLNSIEAVLELQRITFLRTIPLERPILRRIYT